MAGDSAGLARRYISFLDGMGIKIEGEKVKAEVGKVKSALERERLSNAAASSSHESNVVFSISGSLMMRGRGKGKAAGAQASGKRGKGRPS